MHWIKLETTLLDKPEILQMCRVLEIDRYALIGRLVAFWSWCDANTEDGFVPFMRNADVDALVTLPGFADAMISTNWLKVVQNEDQNIFGIQVQNFTKHNGASAKKRANSQKRQQNYRERKRNAVERDTIVTSESLEKRREEIIETNSTNSQKPTETEVETYFSQRNESALWEEFYHYWDDQQWTRENDKGKREPIKSWRKSAATWIRNHNSRYSKPSEFPLQGDAWS